MSPAASSTFRAWRVSAGRRRAAVAMRSGVTRDRPYDHMAFSTAACALRRRCCFQAGNIPADVTGPVLTLLAHVVGLAHDEHVATAPGRRKAPAVLDPHLRLPDERIRHEHDPVRTRFRWAHACRLRA